jgi:hypothetical protein
MLRTLPVILLLTALLCCSCRTTSLPKRAVASMFPTVISASKLEEFTPLQATQFHLDFCLGIAKVRQDLSQAGLSSADREVILRGLAKRGFAEIDARNCSLPWQWLYFASHPDKTLHVVCGFKEKPKGQYMKDISLQGTGLNSWRQGANSSVCLVKSWKESDVQVSCVYKPDFSGEISHWEILNIVHIGGN